MATRSTVAKRAGIYLRVSTAEQSTANQRPELLEMSRARGYEHFSTYEELASGAARERPELERLVRDAHRGAIHAVFVWSIDRLGRQMGAILRVVEKLDGAGVRVVSARESWLDLGDPTMRKLLLAVFGWVAEFERSRLIERTQAGLERARARGVKLGRPRARVDLNAFAVAKAMGYTRTQIARRLGVSPATLFRALASQKRQPKSAQ